MSTEINSADSTPTSPPKVDHTTSYYAASANGSPERELLNDSIEADVCVVGGGFSGLSAALHLSAQGRHVTLLEGARIGWGASGRNGGQLIHGLNASLDTVGKRYGQDTANFIGGLVQEGAGVIRGFIKEHNIECDLKQRSIFAAFNARQMRELEAKQILWRKHGMDEHEMLDKNAISLTVGQKVELSLEAYPELPLVGEIIGVSGFSRTITRGNPTKYFELEVAIVDTGPSLQPGSKVIASIIANEPQQKLIIPLQAIFNEEGANYVYLREGANFVRKTVTTAQKNLYFVEISEGLEEGDVIALSIPEAV